MEAEGLLAQSGVNEKGEPLWRLTEKGKHESESDSRQHKSTRPSAPWGHSGPVAEDPGATDDNRD
jgi:hypothetical protein